MNEEKMSEASQLFSGDPIPPDVRCGWQERQDALHKRPGKPMPGPWNWEIHDHSMATLCGGGEDAIIGHIMAVSPCAACAGRADPKEWEWGRCMTPSIENARLIAAAPDLLEALASISNYQGTFRNPMEDDGVRAQIRAALEKAIIGITAPTEN
jgi:hypothetical protein